jgi:carbonic anhydrase/acetyltransferase-like protein (isoleucine patch superfamily)
MAQGQAIPHIGRQVFIAPSAYIGGDVHVGDGCAIMHQVVIRGDIAPIRIGARTNVQDGTVLHTRFGVPLEIAGDVVIGHRAVVHCRSVGTRSLIGIGSIVLDDAQVGEHCIIAAGAVVLPGTQVPDGSLFAGVPAKRLRDVNERDRAEITRILGVYRDLGSRYAAGEFPNAAGSPAGAWNHLRPPTNT